MLQTRLLALALAMALAAHADGALPQPQRLGSGLELQLTRTRFRGGELDFNPANHVTRHENGTAVLAWLHDHAAVIPELAQQQWPDNLVLGYATGYNFETLKPLIYGFLGNVSPPTLLVLLSQAATVPGMPANFSSRVVVQQHAMPPASLQLHPEALPHFVSLRFYVAAAFLALASHTGPVLWLDTRDVFIQKNPFAPSEHSQRLVFPRESAAYRMRGPYTDNAAWLLQCYGPETMAAIGGTYVHNSGTLLGPGRQLRAYFRLLTRELERRWHCRRQHGSDQAAHNYLISLGKLAGTGLEFHIEDQVTGRFAFVAYTHPAVWDLRAVSDERDEMFNREGQPFAVIHLWPGDNPIANRVVLPYVAEFEACLAAKPGVQRSPCVPQCELSCLE